VEGMEDQVKVTCETCDGAGEIAFQRCGHTGSCCPCGPGYAECPDCEGKGEVIEEFEYHPAYEPPSAEDFKDMAADYAYDEWRNG